ANAEHRFDDLGVGTTHDTKRSEDVRTRMNLLSEVADPWTSHVERWLEQYNSDGRIDKRDAYWFYLTLAGMWPEMHWTAGGAPEAPHLDPLSRLIGPKNDDGYLLKSVHEAKIHSEWVNKSEAYDARIRDYARDHLSNEQFLQEFAALMEPLRRPALWTSLA